MFKLFKLAVKTVLLITGIFPLFRCSSGYKEKNGKVSFNGKEITDKNFIILSDEFAKDSATAYYKEYPFKYADVATFQALDQHYAKDKDKVYYCDEFREGQNYYLTKRQTILEVKEADPASFTIVGSGYGKDSKKAFLKGIAFPVQDIASFTSINSHFARDKSLAYLDGKPIAGSNGKTFTIIDEFYAKDTTHIYFFGYTGKGTRMVTVLPCNQATFLLLDYPYSKDDLSVFYAEKKITGANASTFKVLGHDYSKDENAVYFKSKKMIANAAGFVLLKANEGSAEEFQFAKDDAAIYCDDKRVNGADVASFKVLALGYASDNQSVFYRTSRVIGAKPPSFITYPHGHGDADAEDGNQKYLGGKKIISE